MPSDQTAPPAPCPGPALAFGTKQRHQVGQRLLAWYRESSRDLPWRRLSDPYAVWVSEVMLQQTQVKTVIPYFRRWMDRFSDVETLARSPEDAVLELWQGLGYYSRARALRRGAQEVCARYGGQLPQDAKLLLALPGIGPYTAGAIASIAFGQDEPAVDGNVIRVLTRLAALKGDPARQPLKSVLWECARQLIPTGHAADFNQALMELGATRCTPRSPLCGQCPLEELCRSRQTGTQESYPESAPRPKATLQADSALLLRHRGRWLLQQLPTDAPRWASMWWFPTTTQESDESASSASTRLLRELGAQPAGRPRLHAEVRHSVTRYRITLSLVEVQVRQPIPLASRRQQRLRWVTAAELASLPMPAAHRKLATGLLTATQPQAE